MWGQELSSLSGEIWKETGEESASPQKAKNVGFGEAYGG